MDIALIGCGFIGSVIARSIADKKLHANLRIIFDRHEDKMRKICELFETRPIIAKDMKDIIESNVDLVVEAASIKAVQLFALDILRSTKSMMIMSVGAFADEDFYEEVLKTAEENDVKVYLPSGAIGGLDALNAASIEGIDEVTLETIKHPDSLKGAPHLIKNDIDLTEIKERTVLFEGNAIEAIEGFPANINVAVALSLAGVGVQKTKVRIVADPSVDRNIHKIYVKGEFGEFSFNVRNLPSPQNPRTSYLAALSAIATLQKVMSPLQIG